ncbi:ankyrin [Lindgomyces ingoldianus]|uniref:Ankyrin n=1 Tax=Lindgomyces ingoldianus TaxID=673940 RepID=A0ACB6RB94_9PLEO|nr:ankyrin [Lindgomyces ingoldianus]KAF2475797.1 ankyrin [Lindgomyces ingoldianus]
MDPITIISLLASLTNLIHASKSVIEVINTFRDGDKDLQKLLEDISVFTEALSGFERVLRSRQTIHRISGPVMDSMLQNSFNTIKDLEDRLEQSLNSKVSAVRRMKWVQNTSGIKRLHDRIKEQHSMLQTFLAITHAETFLSVACQYPQYMLRGSAVDNTAAVDDKATASTNLQVPATTYRSRRISNASSLATIESLADTMISSFDSLTLVSSSSSSGSSNIFSRQSSEIPSNTSQETNEGLCQVNTRPELGDSQEILVVRQACRYNCYCICHTQDVTKLRQGLGKRANAKVRCSVPDCLSNATVEEKYAIQSKSFLKTLSKAIFSKSINVRHELKTYRMVPEGSEAMRYVKHGNLGKLKACIESGQATIWDTAPDGWSLLHTAAYNRQLPIVKYLIELGVDTESGDVGSRKPADLAILKSIGQDATQVEHDIVEVFSQKDGFLSDFDFTPIHIAVLELYSASDSERPSLESLIQLVDDANNAPVNTSWSEWKLRYKKRSPLFSAIIEYFRASAFGQPEGTKIIHNLVDQRDKKYSWTPLHWASAAGHVEKMRVLVQFGADPTLLSNLDANILHAAAESKIGRGLAGALDIWRRCPDQLNINQTNRWAETPLHVASWCSAACVSLLLEAGADTDAQQEDGQVPLHCAGLSGRSLDRRDIVSLLCNSKSKKHINIQDADGRPPIFDFLDDQECIEILLQNGARLDLTDESGKNIIHHACIQDEKESLKLLLCEAGDTNIATANDLSGNSPLIEAFCNSSIECALIMLELDDVGDIISKDGWAAVHYAAKIGDERLLEAVLTHSSFMKGMKTMDGKRVDMVAMESGTWTGKVKELIRKYDYLG